MSQTKLQSIREVMTSYAIGFTIGFLTNIFVLPLFGYAVSVSKGLGISVIYTMISIARSYIIRRFFNNKEQLNGKDKCACKTADTSSNTTTI